MVALRPSFSEGHFGALPIDTVANRQRIYASSDALFALAEQLLKGIF